MGASTVTTNAAGISRVLHAAGWKPLPSGTSRMREGIRVTGSAVGVTVTVDLDNEAHALRWAHEIAVLLTEKGYEVEQIGPMILRVVGD